MRIDVVTLFPEMIAGAVGHSILGRAIEHGRLELALTNPRDFTTDRHRTVDDYPYGGGPGMVMKPEPLFAAVEAITRPGCPVVLMSPAGRVFTQQIAAEFAQHPQLVLVCGHYEGVDGRVREHLVTDEVSIGDYVLTGGELPALVVIDAVARLLPGVLGHAESAGDESYSHGLLEYPHYTRPPAFRGWSVPNVLLSGNHAEIARWRRRQSLLRTAERRPDLLAPEHLAELADDGTRKRKRRRPPASIDDRPSPPATTDAPPDVVPSPDAGGPLSGDEQSQ
ncbi:MAG: tRNA (guanosine(37)-N1)-methyltransferase TrmD [Chloroflexi bacterium]|nr:tRNA (guanosine(37)-N1)-methyltransferase TrmD [Chloroflexota bacterium]